MPLWLSRGWSWFICSPTATRVAARTVLYVLGPDGARVQTSVGEWLNRAEERGGDCGPVLFVLDVCHAGAAVGYQLQQLVDADASRRGCWPPRAARIRPTTGG